MRDDFEKSTASQQSESLVIFLFLSKVRQYKDMAQTSSKTTMFLNMALVLSLLLIITIAESRSTLGVIAKKEDAAPNCSAIIDVESGDTCTSIIEALQLTQEFFSSLNPNLNCDALFVGQWLCVDGSA